MEALRLSWRFASPVVRGAHPIHVDALLAYAVTEEGLRNGTSGTVRQLAEDLPLEKEVRGNEWVWKASALLSPEDGIRLNATRMWTRRFPSYDYADRVSREQVSIRTKPPFKPYALVIDTQRGIDKNHFQHFPVVHVDTLVGWCIGDFDRLVELLSPEAGYITHVGAKRRMGFGRIADFSIERDPRAEIAWQKRVLPWPHEGGEPVALACRAPYWAGEEKVLSYVTADVLG